MATKRGGRKPNEWTLITFDEVSAYVEKTGVAASHFAKQVGVTNQTYHNWKQGRCAPAAAIQEKIKNIIEGKTPEEVPVGETETAKTAAKKTKRGRGGSSTLDALAKAAKTTKKKGAKKAPKKAAPAAKAEAAKPTRARRKVAKAGRRSGPKKAAPAVNGNGAHASSPTGWAGLPELAKFLKANEGKSREDVIAVVDMARELTTV